MIRGVPEGVDVKCSDRRRKIPALLDDGGSSLSQVIAPNVGDITGPRFNSTITDVASHNYTNAVIERRFHSPTGHLTVHILPGTIQVWTEDGKSFLACGRKAEEFVDWVHAEFHRQIREHGKETKQ